MNKVLIIILCLCFMLPFFSVGFKTSAAEETELDIHGFDIDFLYGKIIIYTVAGSTTGTKSGATEIVVGSDNVIMSTEGFNNTVPEGGFVIAVKNYSKPSIANAKVGDYAVYNRATKKLAIIGEDYEPSYQKTLTYNGVNVTRSENYIVIYENKETTGTNIWGYEAVVDKNGYVIAIGGNNNEIPDGGFVVSAVGRDRIAELKESVKIGLFAAIDRGAKTVAFEFNTDLILGTAKSGLDRAINDLNKAKSAYRIIDYKKIEELISEANKAYEEAAAYSGYNKNAVYTIAKYKIDELLTKIDDEMIENPAVESRSIWIRPDTQKNEADVKRTVKDIYEKGYNSICLEILFNSTLIIQLPDGHYFEQNPTLKSYDLLAAFIEECHKYDIEVVAWMSVFRVGYDNSPHNSVGLANKKPEWRQISNTGVNYVENSFGRGHFLNPAIKESNDYLLSVYKYIIENYAIDGFQLDYIRYPDIVNGVDFGYDDLTLSLYEEEYGESPKDFTLSSPDWEQWCDFRAGFVTDFIMQLREMVDTLRPDIYLSCDVAPNFKESPYKMMQASPQWIKDAVIDAVYPMAYGENVVPLYSGYAVDAAAESDIFVIVGLADYGSEILKRQIIETRNAGAEGFAFFSYSQYIAGDYDIIAESILKNKCVAPNYNSAAAISAQFDFIKSRIEAIKNQNPDDEKYNKSIVAINSFLEDFDITSHINKENEINGFITDLISDMKLDDAAEKILQSDAKLLYKIIKNSKYDQKQLYYQSNPLPEKYQEESSEPVEASENDAAESEAEEDNQNSPYYILIVLFLIVSAMGIALKTLPKRKK